MPASSLSYRLTMLALVFICLLGAAAVFYGTAWGPWTDDDSAEYIEAARNLAAGEGLVLIRASGRVSPLASRPPLYAIVLSLAPWLGIDILAFARWLDINLYAGFLFLLVPVLYRMIGRPWPVLLLSLTTLVSPFMLKAFTSGLAEPLHFVLATASLLLLVAYLRSKRLKELILSAILAGLSTLARLSGLAVMGTGALLVLTLGGKRFRTRMARGLLYGLISSIVILPWIIDVMARGSTPGVYNFSLEDLWGHLAGVRVGFAALFWNYLPFSRLLPAPPYRVQLFVSLVVGATLLVLLGLAIRERIRRLGQDWHNSTPWHLVLAFGLYALIYVGVFLFSHLFMTISRALVIARHLTALELGIFVSGIMLVYVLLDHYKLTRASPWIALSLVLGLSLPMARSGFKLLSDLHAHGRGHTHKSWHQSEVIPYLRSLPQDVPLISNEIEAIIIWTNRKAYRVPEIWDRTRLPTFERFGEDPNDPIQRIFRIKGMALILFDSARWQFESIYGDRADQRLAAFTNGLLAAFVGDDGAVYYYPASRSD